MAADPQHLSRLENILCYGCPQTDVLAALQAAEASDDIQLQVVGRTACAAIRAGQDSYNGPEVVAVDSSTGCGLAFRNSCANPEMQLARAILKLPVDELLDETNLLPEPHKLSKTSRFFMGIAARMMHP